MRNRTGKIARLPRHIREDLNHRLEGNHPGRQIVDWLNSLPEVQEVLEGLFHGKPVSEQNLSEWRHGGYAEWLTRREFVEDVQEKAHDAADIEEASALMADHAAGLLAIRYADTLTKWNGDPADPAFASLKHLSGLVRDVAILSRRAERTTRLKMDQFAFDAACHSRGKLKPDEVRFAGSPYVRKWSRRFGPADPQSYTEEDAVSILEGLEARLFDFWDEHPEKAPPSSSPASAERRSTSPPRQSHGIKPSQTIEANPEKEKRPTKNKRTPEPAPTPPDATTAPEASESATPGVTEETTSAPAVQPSPPAPVSDEELWQMRNRPLPGDPEPEWRKPVKTIPPWELNPSQTYAPFEPKLTPRRAILARADR